MRLLPGLAGAGCAVAGVALVTASVGWALITAAVLLLLLDRRI